MILQQKCPVAKSIVRHITFKDKFSALLILTQIKKKKKKKQYIENSKINKLTLNKTKKVNIHNPKHQRKIFTLKDKQNTIHSRLKI